MKLRNGAISTVLSALALVFLTIPAFAQDFRGKVAGTIKDATGGVLPGVTVTVTNAGTNGTSTVVTDAKGYYEVPHLNSGVYSVEAKLEGFKTVLRKGIELRVGDELKIDLSLEPGGVSEVISVIAATPILDT